MEPTKVRVAVCGGGVGGLTLALALSRYPNIVVDIYEAASQFSEIGAGVGFYPRVWKILKELGLEDDLLQVTQQRPTDEYVSGFTYRKCDQKDGLEFYKMVTRGEAIQLHRADFHGVLLKHLAPSCKTHCSKRLHSYKQPKTDPIELYFQDGSVAICDVLVGADGIKSAVRGCMLQEQASRALDNGDTKLHRDILSCIDPVWSGIVTYRTLISADSLRDLEPDHRALSARTQYLAKDAFIIVYPVSQGKFVNFAAFCHDYNRANTTFDGPWVKEVSKQDVFASFADSEPEVLSLIKCIDKANLWAVHTIKPLHAMNFDRVAILGDAAHAMVPFLGAGAGQAIEDAYILAEILGHSSTLGSVPHALHVYDSIRRPFATDIVERSSQQGKLLTFQGMEFDSCCDAVVRRKLQDLGDNLKKTLEWTWLTSIDEMRRNALTSLGSTCKN